MPSPLFSRYFVNWIMTQTLSGAQDAMTREVKRRIETGDLGSYQGVLFKDSFRSSGDASASQTDAVDMAIVCGVHKELVGVLDQMRSPSSVKGDGFQYYHGKWKGFRVALIETGYDFDRTRKGVEAIISAFRPTCVASIGFASSLVDHLKSGDLVAPDALINEKGERLEFQTRALPTPEVETQSTDTDASADRACANGAETSETSAASDETLRKIERAREILRRFATGTVLSLSREPSGAKERRELAAGTDAVACDRHVWAVAQVCVAAGAPFLPLLAIDDLDGEARSREALQVARSNQSVARRLGALFGATTKRPSAILELCQMKEREIAAADKLAEALASVLTLVSAN